VRWFIGQFCGSLSALMSRSGVTSAASAGGAAITTPASIVVVSIHEFLPVRMRARRNAYEFIFWMIGRRCTPATLSTGLPG